MSTSCRSRRVCCPVRIRRAGRITAGLNVARVDRRGFRRRVFGEVFGERFFFYIFLHSFPCPSLPTRSSRENTSIKIESRRHPPATVSTARRPRDASKTGRPVDRKFIAGIRSKAFRSVFDRASPNAAATVVWGLHARRPSWCDGPVFFFISSFFFAQ